MITFLIYVYEFYSPTAVLSYSGESSILLFLNLVFHEDSAPLTPPMIRDTDPKFDKRGSEVLGGQGFSGLESTRLMDHLIFPTSSCNIL